MVSVFRIAPALIFLILPFFPSFGQSPASSPWEQGLNSRVRLISGGLESGRRLAGIEIVLNSGFKTYWRTPGASGLPPRFDWSGSDNVSAVEIRWPAPTRHEDAGGVAYVYSHKVVLPVLVTPTDPARPVKLALSLDYGICKDICIPAHAELSATLSGEGLHGALLEEAMAQVPRPQPLGAKAELSVVDVRPSGQDEHAFEVAVRAPAGTRPDLFAEGPENWYLSTSSAGDGNRFTVTVEDKPKDAAGPVPVRLTLVADGKAVETEVNLDGGTRPR